jgi:hypothetical protein
VPASRSGLLSRGGRVARSLVFAVVTVALATAAHAYAMGATPPAASVLGAVGIVALLAAPLSARECRTPVLLAGVGAVQLALHVLMSLSMGTAPMPMWWCARPGVTLPAGFHTGRTESISMVAGHVGAGLLVALWLRSGERAAFSLATALGLSLARGAQRVLVAVSAPLVMDLDGAPQVSRVVGQVPSRLRSRLVPVCAGRAPPPCFA